MGTSRIRHARAVTASALFIAKPISEFGRQLDAKGESWAALQHRRQVAAQLGAVQASPSMVAAAARPVVLAIGAAHPVVAGPITDHQPRGHFLSVGFGHKGERFDFDVAYQFGYGPDRRVSGSAPSATGQTADGTYNFISHALSVSVSWHF